VTGRRQNPHFRKILVGYDASPQSEKAVDIALSLAARLRQVTASVEHNA